MVTIRNLRLMLEHFSDTDLVEAYEGLDETDIELSNILGIFKSVPMPPGHLPVCGEPIGHIDTLGGTVTVFTGDEEDTEVNP